MQFERPHCKSAKPNDLYIIFPHILTPSKLLQTSPSSMELNRLFVSKMHSHFLFCFCLDGIMVQLMPEVIDKLRHALKEMHDYTITTGTPGGGGEELVIVEWVSRQNSPQQTRYSLYDQKSTGPFLVGRGWHWKLLQEKVWGCLLVNLNYIPKEDQFGHRLSFF